MRLKARIPRKKIQSLLRNLKTYDPERVILFGSSASGSADRYSDLDIVVIKETSKRFVERLREVAVLLPDTFDVDTFVYTPEEWERMIQAGNPIASRVLKEGVTIYERTEARGRKVA